MKRSSSLKSKDIGDIDSYLGYWLRFVSNYVTSSFQQFLAEKDITVAEWIALRFLVSHAPCSLTKLADEIGIDKGAVSRLTDRLEKRKLITRTVTEKDRRLFSMELTPAGKELVPQLAKLAEEHDERIFGHLTSNEKNKLFSLLKDLAGHHQLRGKPID